MLALPSLKMVSQSDQKPLKNQLTDQSDQVRIYKPGE